MGQHHRTCETRETSTNKPNIVLGGFRLFIYFFHIRSVALFLSPSPSLSCRDSYSAILNSIQISVAAVCVFDGTGFVNAFLLVFCPLQRQNHKLIADSTKFYT